MENKKELVRVLTFYINKNGFKEFLDKNLKNKYYSLNAYIDDLVSQIGNTGFSEYELSSRETKSGKPEIHYFTKYDEFGKEIK